MELRQCRKCLAWRPKFQKRCQCEKWAFSVRSAVREMHLLEKTDARVHVFPMHDPTRPISCGTCCKRNTELCSYFPPLSAGQTVCCSEWEGVYPPGGLYLRTAIEKVRRELKEILKREGACGSN